MAGQSCTEEITCVTVEPNASEVMLLALWKGQKWEKERLWKFQGSTGREQRGNDAWLQMCHSSKKGKSYFMGSMLADCLVAVTKCLAAELEEGKKVLLWLTV